MDGWARIEGCLWISRLGFTYCFYLYSRVIEVEFLCRIYVCKLCYFYISVKPSTDRQGVIFPAWRPALCRVEKPQYFQWVDRVVDYSKKSYPWNLNLKVSNSSILEWDGAFWRNKVVYHEESDFFPQGVASSLVVSMQLLKVIWVLSPQPWHVASLTIFRATKNDILEIWEVLLLQVVEDEDDPSCLVGAS